MLGRTLCERGDEIVARANELRKCKLLARVAQDVEQNRLDQGQGTDAVGMSERQLERHHPAIRIPHQVEGVGATSQQWLQHQPLGFKREAYTLRPRHRRAIPDQIGRQTPIVGLQRRHGAVPAITVPQRSVEQEDCFAPSLGLGGWCCAASGGGAGHDALSGAAGRVVFGVRLHRSRSATGSFMCDAGLALAAAIAIVGAFARRVESLPRNPGWVINPRFF
jgi:hypothetical protein